jgi:hypothetical protein
MTDKDDSCAMLGGLTHSLVLRGTGIDAEGLSADLDCHHLIVNSWGDLEAPQNVCIASIPTVFNAALAPLGKALVHAYTAGNEPYSLWQGLDRRSPEYKCLKVRAALSQRLCLSARSSCSASVVHHGCTSFG